MPFHRITLNFWHLMWPVSQINIKDSFVSLRFNEPFFHIFLLPGTKESMSMKATNGRDDWCFESCLHVCVRV